MRIDTDLITYLSHVLLPQHMTIRNSPQVQSASSNQDRFVADELSSPQKSTNFFQYQEAGNDDTQEPDELYEEGKSQRSSSDNEEQF